ncbi:MAG: DUF2063 domain-containing protein [Legionellales bacterium]
MSELSQIQGQFQDFILRGHLGIDSSIVATEQVNVVTRLGIYKDAYRLRLLECLTNNFESLSLLLGAEAFEQLATAYLTAHPSTYRSVRWYGDSLADFIKQYYKKSRPYLSELAEFEWNLSLAFDAADEQIVQVEDMALIPPESWAGLQFIPHKSLQRMQCMWNVVPVWQALMEKQPVPEFESTSKATPFVIWRSLNYQTKFYSLADEEAWALDVMIQGLSFGELCEGLCQWVDADEVGMRAATYLKGWISQGMLAQLLIAE